MKVLTTLWGLIVDDGRLVSFLLLFIVIGAVLSFTHLPLIGAILIWLGLPVSLLISIEHQINKKRNG